MQNNTPIINSVKNRFLSLSESVLKCLEPEPKLSDFKIEKELGKGTFGRVYLVHHKLTKAKYAIKAIDKLNKSNIHGKPYFRREIEIMYKIHHPNVVCLFSHFEDNQNCYFIMEYINQGNLYAQMSKQTSRSLDPKTVASYMKDLISAVYYLHNMDPPIIHRDIKPENVLLTENNIVKLTDFGWSNYIAESIDQRTTFCGTPVYLAPEMIRHKGHDWRVDIWDIGVLMFELLVGRPPFSGHSKEALMSNILCLRINWPNDMNVEARSLIEKILVKDPTQRLSLREILSHPFFTKYYPNGKNALIKPESYNIEPYIICKDLPTKIYKKVVKKERMISRDISPNVVSRLNLDKLMKIGWMKKKIKEHKESNNSNNSHLGKDYDGLMQRYNSLTKNYDDSVKNLNEITTKVKFLQKEKDIILKELDEKEEMKLSYIRKIVELKLRVKETEGELQIGKGGKVSVLKRKLEEKEKEILMLKEKLNISTASSENENTITAKGNEKEYEMMIEEKNNEIKKLKEERESMEKMHIMVINKYEQMIKTKEKKYNVKIKELEDKIAKLNNKK